MKAEWGQGLVTWRSGIRRENATLLSCVSDQQSPAVLRIEAEPVFHMPAATISRCLAVDMHIAGGTPALRLSPMPQE